MSLKEEDIRKRDIFNRYLSLVEKDVIDFFDFSTFQTIACPACESNEQSPEFKKLGFTYVSCNKCHTLYVNPRPPFAVLNKFYAQSPSTSFWVNEFFMPVAEIRRNKIFRPRAEQIRDRFSSSHQLVIGDIGAGFGIFLEELEKVLPRHKYIAIEPSLDMAHICRDKGLNVICSTLEEIDSHSHGFDLLTAFELTEHLFEPRTFFKKTHSLLNKGGYFYLTTLNGKGFDISLLWDKSKSVTPPHHLNFLNTDSIQILLNKNGFDVVEITTPGELDWDIVEGMIIKEGYDLGRFWNCLAAEGNESTKKTLQSWISNNNLSSHMRILARKPF